MVFAAGASTTVFPLTARPPEVLPPGLCPALEVPTLPVLVLAVLALVEPALAVVLFAAAAFAVLVFVVLVLAPVRRGVTASATDARPAGFAGAMVRLRALDTMLSESVAVRAETTRAGRAFVAASDRPAVGFADETADDETADDKTADDETAGVLRAERCATTLPAPAVTTAAASFFVFLPPFADVFAAVAEDLAAGTEVRATTPAPVPAFRGPAAFTETVFTGTFSAAIFPPADFETLPFEETDFEGATFADVGLAEADFGATTFAETDFTEAGLAETGLAETALAETALAEAALAETALAVTALAAAGLMVADFAVDFAVDFAEVTFAGAVFTPARFTAGALTVAVFLGVACLSVACGARGFTIPLVPPAGSARRFPVVAVFLAGTALLATAAGACLAEADPAPRAGLTEADPAPRAGLTEADPAPRAGLTEAEAPPRADFAETEAETEAGAEAGAEAGTEAGTEAGADALPRAGAGEVVARAGRVVGAGRSPVPTADRGFGPVPEAAGLVEAFLAAGIEVFLSNDCGHDGAGRGLAGSGGLRQLASPVQRASSASHSALRFSTVSSARVASSAVA